MAIQNILNTIFLKIKELFFYTLTEENLEKIIRKNEKEICDIKLIEKQILEEVREELRTDLREAGYTNEDEIEEMISISLGLENETSNHS
uniref:Uncharacterized protein n=1 Tax=viral metagenome TaxID=1070528 RepID=A0A6M3JLD0_9ZZZZ